MKRLISLFIIFVTTTIACMTTAMASFVVDNTEINHNNMMQEKIIMSLNDCYEIMQWDCTETVHECCISPFSDGAISSNIHNTNSKKETIKWKILDFSFLTLSQENLEENYIDRLNSPPKLVEVSELDNFYITLTGSIKSNC